MGSFIRLPCRSYLLPMKFILLFHLDEKHWAGLTAAKRDRLWAECDQLAREFAAGGHSGPGAALHPSSTATTLRLQSGRRVINDGPFAETKEVLAGFQVVDCRDLDEALELAARFPPLRVGASVEVRPVMEGSTSD